MFDLLCGEPVASYLNALSFAVAADKSSSEAIRSDRIRKAAGARIDDQITGLTESTRTIVRIIKILNCSLDYAINFSPILVSQSSAETLVRKMSEIVLDRRLR